ncbi:Hypothetical predicted protein, partial [Paramuricea clavata]
MSDICILCLNVIVKINEKHRVEGKGAFKVIPELESFSFKVERVSPFICAGCVKKLKKRRNLITQIECIDEFYRTIQTKSTCSSSSSLKRTSDISLDSVGIKIHCGNEGERSPSTSTETIERPSSSSRCSSPVRPDNIPPQWPVSPIKHRENSEEGPKSTNVYVKVEWPSKNAERKLPGDLESLGKMLVRGTYKQIANAAWKNTSIKKQLQLLMLNDINRECSDLCSRKNPSCLRSPNKENMLKFSIEHFNKELKKRAPLTFSVLVAASVNPRSRSRANKNGLNIETFWSPAVGMAAAVCLRNRSRFMNALQLLITIFNYHSGWQATLARLASLRITTSHTYLYKKLDEYGAGYQEHQNIDVHHVTVMSTENRIGAVDFSDQKKEDGIMKLENGKFIPSDDDHQLQRKNFITLVVCASVGSDNNNNALRIVR